MRKLLPSNGLVGSETTADAVGHAKRPFAVALDPAGYVLSLSGLTAVVPVLVRAHRALALQPVDQTVTFTELVPVVRR